ncbi:MAG: methyltransferase domain-containing protein [Candidatus Thermoplasmatota archaeon]|nr:methyltransferase domain-containing protein [Candidatus Thermoplasmatota archaeon]
MSNKKVEPFEKHTARYEGWFSRNRGAYLSELDAVSALLPEGDGVEIGVGTGRFAGPVGIGLGIDPSLEMIKVAKRSGIEVVRGVAEALPLRSASLDTALMVTTICFVDSPGDAMGEAYRILRPGGSLVVGFIDRNSPLGRQYMERKGESVFYREARFYSVDELGAALEEAGFGHLEFVQTLTRPLGDIETKEPIMKGHGRGSFVAIRARKPED